MGFLGFLTFLGGAAGLGVGRGGGATALAPARFFLFRAPGFALGAAGAAAPAVAINATVEAVSLPANNSTLNGVS